VGARRISLMHEQVVLQCEDRWVEEVLNNKKNGGIVRILGF